MFVCKDCGFESKKWEGKCPSCGEWNSFKETSRFTGKNKKNLRSHFDVNEVKEKPTSIREIEVKTTDRMDSGFSEFNCVLGGGIVPGMVALIGGEPGIGKSTIMLQLANIIAKNKKVLYVSGEESRQQIRIRSERLSVTEEKLLLFCSVSVEEISEAILNENPDLVIIDSIQSVYISDLDGVPGSISQLREVASRFTRLAKVRHIPFFLIGHVTKDGAVAGPKIIEHMVDTVLYFESERNNQYRIIRTTKNRFGSTNEIGIFEMTDRGLVEVLNPSQVFLDQTEQTIGTAISSVIEGSRAFLVEVQALVTEANYGTPQRVALGIDHKRLAVIIAIIEKHLHINLRSFDVFITVSGDRKVIDQSLDTAVIAAILSSFQNLPLPPKCIIIGEVSLNGDVRSISSLEKRTKEAQKLGFEKFLLPQTKYKIEAAKIKHIRQMYPVLFPREKK